MIKNMLVYFLIVAKCPQKYKFLATYTTFAFLAAHLFLKYTVFSLTLHQTRSSSFLCIIVKHY